MVTDGDRAPDFTAPLAHGDDDIGSFTLSDHLTEAPLVLVFFPGAFTSTCSHEMNTFQVRLSAFEDTGATIYGISVDSPFAQNAFRERLGLEYGLVSDANREIIAKYGVSMTWEQYGLKRFAKRAVFVVNGDGEITYAWVVDDTKSEPDYDEVLAAVDAATACPGRRSRDLPWFRWTMIECQLLVCCIHPLYRSRRSYQPSRRPDEPIALDTSATPRPIRSGRPPPQGCASCRPAPAPR